MMKVFREGLEGLVLKDVEVRRTYKVSFFFGKDREFLVELWETALKI